MPSVEIKTIGNEYLKKAAESADKDLNGKLDSHELVIFMQSATKKCNALEIEGLVKEVGIDKSDNTTQAKLNDLQKIDQLKNQIVEFKGKLKKCKYELEKREVQPSTVQALGALGGAIAGMYAGLHAAAPIAAVMGSTGIGAVAGAATMVVGALGGFAGGAYAAYKGIDYAQRPFESHETKVQRKDAENYEQNVVKPLETKIKELEQELESRLEKFYQ